MVNNKIVIDHGSYSIKYGYAGSNKPEDVIRSVVIRDGSETITDINESFIRGFHGMDTVHPIKNGHIIDFDAMECIWSTIFDEKLSIDPMSTSVLITEPFSATNKTRDTIKEIMFEKYGFKQLQFCNQQIVSLYGSGRSTGILLDIGHDITRCISVYDSYTIGASMQFSNLAGKELNGYISDFLKFKKYDDEMTDYKKKYFRTENNKLYRKFFTDADNGLATIINRCIRGSDIDLRTDLAKNIVMVGGTSKIPGLHKDIYNSLNKINNLKYKISAGPNRDISAWQGGSILSSIHCFEWLDKNDR
jgi:actin-related protein